jgi:Spy/CpxP family protein refolding chaperone
MSKTRRRATAVLATLALAATSVVVPASLADPAFGPGNKGGGQGNSGPQVGKCHPPGQTTTTPGCK